jgi:hypothetical protein
MLKFIKITKKKYCFYAKFEYKRIFAKQVSVKFTQ